MENDKKELIELLVHKSRLVDDKRYKAFKIVVQWEFGRREKAIPDGSWSNMTNIVTKAIQFYDQLVISTDVDKSDIYKFEVTGGGKILVLNEKVVDDIRSKRNPIACAKIREDFKQISEEIESLDKNEGSIGKCEKVLLDIEKFLQYAKKEDESWIWYVKPFVFNVARKKDDLERSVIS